METRRIVVAGAGHLSFQVYTELTKRGYDPVRVVGNPLDKTIDARSERPVYVHYKEMFEAAGIAEADVVFLVDDEDYFNIQFFLIVTGLNPNAQLVMSLFNESLAPHLRSGHQALTVFNPAAIAAMEFAKAAEKKKTRRSPHALVDIPELEERPNYVLFNTTIWLVGVFVSVLVLSTYVFHFYYGLSWLDSFYFTSTTLTTTGSAEDIAVARTAPLLRLFGAALMFFGVAFTWITFSFIVEWLLARRAELALGRKKYQLKGHIIVCGLGRLGYQVTLELLKRGAQVLAIESNPDNQFIDHVRASGGKVFVADATLPRNLRLANVWFARSVLSLVQHDTKNIEIGLTARSLRPSMPLVLRIFDTDIAQEISNRLSIPVTLSASAIVTRYLLKEYAVQNN